MGVRDWLASTLESVSRLSDWIGLGPLVDQAVSETGKVLSTAELNAIIDRLVKEASSKGNLVVSQLYDRLNSLLATTPKSNLYRSALLDGVKQLQSKIIKADDISKAAEAALTEAKTHSSNIDTLPVTQRMDWGGKGKQLRGKAISAALEAEEKFKELEKL